MTVASVFSVSGIAVTDRLRAVRPEIVDGAADLARPRRGWLGLKHANRADWDYISALGGDVAPVIVEAGSPCKSAGLLTGDCIESIDGGSLVTFLVGPPAVGTTVRVKAYRPGRAEPFLFEVTLIEPPKPQRAPRPSRARTPQVDCGRTAFRRDRPKWETKLATSGLTPRAVQLGIWLANVVIRDNGTTTNTSIKSMMKALRCATSTICRALRELNQAGFLGIESGRKEQVINKLTTTFPVEPAVVLPPNAEVVVPFFGRAPGCDPLSREENAGISPNEHVTAAAPCPEKPHAVFEGTYKELGLSKMESDRETSEAIAWEAGASRPVYTDSRHELWGEGIPILESLGVKQSRPIIGRWLKDTKDDAQRVLGAIQRARDARVIDPIPWITRALISENSRVRHGTHRNGGGFALNTIEFAQRAAGQPDCPDHSGRPSAGVLRARD